MKVEMFEKMEDAKKFLSIYSVEECIINIDNVGRIWVWVNKVKLPSGETVKCPYCNELTFIDGTYCQHCGEKMRIARLC